MICLLKELCETCCVTCLIKHNVSKLKDFDTVAFRCLVKHNMSLLKGFNNVTSRYIYIKK
jgi:hypothetical protein